MRDPGAGFHPFHGRVSKHFGESLKAADPYLSYYDVCLTKEDIDTLKDDWLTDNVIAFWEENLEREVLSQYPRTSVVLLRPSMSFLLMQTPDPSTLRQALPAFDTTTHIFLPINDCRNPAIAEGGSHWSLLVVSIDDNKAYHYDSLDSANKSVAQLAMNKVSQLLNRRLEFFDLEDSPQQENGSDCGVFVCLNMKHLLNRLLKTNKDQKTRMNMEDRIVDASTGRKSMLKTIEGFRKEGERRRSRSSSPYPLDKKSNSSQSTKSRSPPRIE